MTDPHIVILGGGIAGLSAACYARANGFRTTIVEHDPARSKGCKDGNTAAYTFGGWAHCLAGGPFQRAYEELGILPRVSLRRVERFFTYHDPADHFDLSISSDLESMAQTLQRIAPEDTNEIQLLVQGVRIAVRLALDRVEGPTTVCQQLAMLHSVRGDLEPLAHFRQTVGAWSTAHLKSDRLRRVLSLMLPDGAPALLLLLLLGYLKRGHLRRPVDGMARIREALQDTYDAHGGGAVLHATVDRALVHASRVRGVRLKDGTVIEADAVVSTAGIAETLRLLGADRRAFEPGAGESNALVVASYGVASALAGAAPTQLIDHIEPLLVGGVANECLRLRLYSEDSSFAPAGHAVVQVMLKTRHDFGTGATSRDDAWLDDLAARTLERLDAHLPGAIKSTVEVAHLATTFTIPSGGMPGFGWPLRSTDVTLPGWRGFFFAGDCGELGGGLHDALASARHVVQLLCAEYARPFLAQASRPRLTGARE